MNIEKQAERELKKVLAAAKKKGNVTIDGQWVKKELEQLGWIAKSYAKTGHSKYSYRCGYSGNYNQATMVKNPKVGK